MRWRYRWRWASRWHCRGTLWLRELIEGQKTLEATKECPFKTHSSSSLTFCKDMHVNHEFFCFPDFFYHICTSSFLFETTTITKVHVEICECEMCQAAATSEELGHRAWLSSFLTIYNQFVKIEKKAMHECTRTSVPSCPCKALSTRREASAAFFGGVVLHAPNTL